VSVVSNVVCQTYTKVNYTVVQTGVDVDARELSVFLIVSVADMSTYALKVSLGTGSVLDGERQAGDVDNSVDLVNGDFAVLDRARLDLGSLDHTLDKNDGFKLSLVRLADEHTEIPAAYLSICFDTWCSSPSLAMVRIPWRV
jgi:hypothetical protein